MNLISFAMLGLLLAACGSLSRALATAGSPLMRAVTVSSRAVLDTDIDLTSCAAKAAAATAGCPAFIVAAAAEMKKTCAEVGGTLHPASKPDFWQLDINADGRNEYLVDFAENFYCDGAPSLFSCGSLGCPYILYQERDGKWAAAGGFGAGDAPQIEVLAGAGPAILRGGCGGVRPCDELTSYTWNGQVYEATTIEVPGAPGRYRSRWPVDDRQGYAGSRVALARCFRDGALPDGHGGGRDWRCARRALQVCVSLQRVPEWLHGSGRAAQDIVKRHDGTLHGRPGVSVSLSFLTGRGYRAPDAGIRGYLLPEYASNLHVYV